MIDSLGNRTYQEEEIIPTGFYAYPVFLKNETNDTLQIGSGNYIYMIVEAVDSFGVWRPIQRPYVYFCGTGLNSIIIFPNEYMITACDIFNGDYSTKLRLKLKRNNNLLSNEFYGKIYYSQFKSL